MFLFCLQIIIHIGPALVYIYIFIYIYNSNTNEDIATKIEQEYVLFFHISYTMK